MLEPIKEHGIVMLVFYAREASEAAEALNPKLCGKWMERLGCIRVQDLGSLRVARMQMQTLNPKR